MTEPKTKRIPTPVTLRVRAFARLERLRERRSLVARRQAKAAERGRNVLSALDVEIAEAEQEYADAEVVGGAKGRV